MMIRGQALLLALIVVIISTEAFAPRGAVHHVGSSWTKTNLGLTCTTSSARSSLFSSARHATCLYSSQEEEEEEGWHPIDMECMTPQLLSALWFMIAQDCSRFWHGQGRKLDTYIFPQRQMKDKFSPSYLNSLMGHLHKCKDVCDSFGTKTVSYPYKDNKVWVDKMMSDSMGICPFTSGHMYG